MKQRVAIASGNPVKINAAKRAFRRAFPDFEFTFSAVPASSEVSNQPIGIEQTLLGAENRVENVIKKDPDYEFFVGMEGGVYSFDSGWYAFAWMVVRSVLGLTGRAMTGFFPLPPEIIRLLDNGFELGDAMDKVFDKNNSKQKGGAVGLLTNELIDRTTYYEHALILALTPFLNRDLFT